jgi:hypothetical protein
MPTKPSPALRFYELLLKFYPADFLGRYENQLLCVFEESWHDTEALSDPAAALIFWLHTSEDIIRTAVCTRLSQLARRNEFGRSMSLAASILMHTAVLWGLTWIAFHPFPPPGPSCDSKAAPTAVIKTAALPKVVGSTN